MKSKSLFIYTVGLLGLFAFPGEALAQDPVSVSYDKTDKNYVFQAVSYSDYPCTVVVKFSQLQGTHDRTEGSEEAFLVKPKDRRTLFTLRPASSDDDVSFSYSYTTCMGDYVSKPDTSFVYLSPLAPGKEVVMLRMVDLSDYIAKKKKAKRANGISFNTEEGDTIYAMRAGLVCEVVDDKELNPDVLTAYDSKENLVCICHKDGSMAMYRRFQAKGIFVSPGDKVCAGQPIGIIGGKNYSTGSRLSLVMYAASPSDDKDAFCGKKMEAFVPVIARTEKETLKLEDKARFTSVHPQEIIMKEMSKKEKKAYLKK